MFRRVALIAALFVVCPVAWAVNIGAQAGQKVQIAHPATTAAAQAVVDTAKADAATPPQPPQLTPSLLGMTCEQAQRFLIDKKLQMRVRCPAGDTLGQVQPGTINRQDPDIGAAVPQSRVVEGFLEPDPVSQPAEPSPTNIAATPAHKPAVHRYVVPQLYGQTCPGALERAQKAGFLGVKCLESASDEKVKEGTVYQQKPRADTVTSKPTPIYVWIKKTVTRVVPSLVGDTVRQAMITIAGARLRGQVDGISAAALAVVQSQDPEARSVVPEGTSVRLTTVIVVPDLSGVRCQAAKTLAVFYGLVVSDCQAHEPLVDTSPLGRVYDQEPRAGSTLLAIRAVTVRIAAHEVPPVEGERLAQAETELRAKHLIPVPDVATDPDHRIVRTQNPKAGALYETPIKVELTTVGLAIVPPLRDLSCADAGERLVEKGLGSDCHADLQWWSVGAPKVYAQTQKSGSEQTEGTVITSYAKAIDMGKIGVTLLAVLAAAGTAVLVFRPSMHVSVRLDANPEIAIRETDKVDADFMGVAVRGESDPEGSPIIRLKSKGDAS